ncbi:MAG: glycosyltransferase family 39 protein [Spirulinaceae cyanobacterium]
MFNDKCILVAIWLIAVLRDRLWLALDKSVPAWDQGNHLTGSLNYLNALQNAQLLSGTWWQSLWMLSKKYPPLTYVSTAPWQQVFGSSPDNALLVNLFFSGILLTSVYLLGKELFNSQAGLWGAGICVLLPAFYILRLNYLVDYSLIAMGAASFTSLTIWHRGKSWYWALGFGFCFGLAMLAKPTILIFFCFPLLWIGATIIWQRKWQAIAQLITALLLTLLICGPWYRTNWLFAISSYERGIVGGAMAEGDPPLNTLAAWTHYLQTLPVAFTFPLLLVPIVGFLLYLPRWWRKLPQTSTLRWLLIFFIPAYLINSAIVNKDTRYVMVAYPVLAVVLGYGLTLYPKRWRGVAWGTMGLSFLLMCLNLFPVSSGIGTYITQLLSPNAQYHPYLGATWPHEEVIAKINRTTPHLQTNLGVLMSTPQLNNHNFNYYGALTNFQVYGREVSGKEEFIATDARAFDWFVTKTGDLGSVPPSQTQMVQRVESGQDFFSAKTWTLPDNTLLKLYRKKLPAVAVQSLPNKGTQVKLASINIPSQAPPGQPIPVTYQWTGPSPELQAGLVVLTWQHRENVGANTSWFHDHGIGLGQLHLEDFQDSFQVTERTAMLPEIELQPGEYQLQATYLNRKTGESYPLVVPEVTIKINPQVAAIPAPELDLVTQLRNIAPGLSEGITGLEPIFAQTGRINQYDPTQDYLAQAETALVYRLQQRKNLNWGYGLALARALQRDVQGTKEALQQIIALDSQNPYPHAYLAFVNLYDFHPRTAQKAIQPALQQNPDSQEFQAINGIAALMQGNIFRAWQNLYPLVDNN